MVLFADDTTISAIGSSFDEVKLIIIKDLECINEWLAHNRLIVNWSKTNHMVLGSNMDDDLPTLSISNHVIVEIDSNLKLDKHINAICSKVNKKAFILSRRFYLFNLDFRSILFKLFIMPHFDYCSSLFCFNNCSTLYKCYIKNLKLFLNLDIHNNDNLSEQQSKLKHFNILPLKLRFFTHYCSFLHSLFSNQLCSPLINLFIKPNYSLSLRTPFLLPTYTKKYGLNSLLFIGTKFLNSFIFSYASISKKAFKEYLMSNCVYYYNMHIHVF